MLVQADMSAALLTQRLKPVKESRADKRQRYHLYRQKHAAKHVADYNPPIGLDYASDHYIPGIGNIGMISMDSPGKIS